MENISFLIALLAGILSFLSPCVLPLLPSYLSFITGISLEELLKEDKNPQLKRVAIIHSLMFILGFSAIFILLGASASLVGQVLSKYREWIARIGGVVIIVFGIHLMGIIKLPLLEREKRFYLRDKPLGYLGSCLVGIAFAAGWTPCIGPILGSILFYAGSADSMLLGMSLLGVYSLGLGIPFFLSSLGLQIFLEHYARLRKYLRWISIISGLLLIAAGILLMTNYLSILSFNLTEWLSF